MRIVLDLQGAQTVSRYRGIGRYSLSLAKAIARQAGEHEVWVCLSRVFGRTLAPLSREFAGLVPRDHIVSFDAVPPVAARNPANRWRRRASELVRHDFLENLQPDVVLSLSLFEGWLDDAIGSVEFDSSFHQVAILYDLIPLLNPEVYLAGDLTHEWYMEKLAALKRCDHLLAISNYSCQEGISTLDYPAAQITAISCAAGPEFQRRDLSQAEQRALNLKLGIKRPFLLYNGAMEWRKNVDRLLEAFSRLPIALRHDFDLVLAGKTSPEDRRRLSRLASRLGISGNLALTGFVTDEDLAALYSMCSAFVFPSLHEGFGLPVLEAMSCGAAVIASNATSVPEVVGREDALFDPTDLDSMSAKIEQVLVDERFRASLQAHGKEQARRFSWDGSARRALEVIESLGPKTRTAERSGNGSSDGPARAATSLLERLASIPAAHGKPTQTDLAATAVAIARNEKTLAAHLRLRELPTTLHWLVEGPVDSSYSLALVNRETARALTRLGHEVAIRSTDGPGDIEPDAAFLAENPDLAHMRGRLADPVFERPAVGSRLMYPPRVDDMAAATRVLHHYAWEESAFPHGWAAAFNDYLEGITCLSRHVHKTLVDAGVSVPLSVSGCGTDHWNRIPALPYHPSRHDRFRFLHVSSCFPRKGVDVLLEAYGRAFQGRDDVELIIKTFDNPHNAIDKWLSEARARSSDYPPVTVISRDLGEGELKGLFEASDVLVAPSRAEGFGLPLAEAMLSGVPVITTAWGGQLDFCNSDSAWLIDFDFASARTHFDLPGSVWAEPRIGSLVEAMRDAVSLPKSALRQRAECGAEILRKRFTWQQATERLIDSVRTWACSPVYGSPETQRVGWVSTWGTRCGVASYSRHLTEALQSDVHILAAEPGQGHTADSDDVTYCWTAGGGDSLVRLKATIERGEFDVVVVQFNYNFFDFHVFARFAEDLVAFGVTLVIELHSTVDPPGVDNKRLELIRPALAACDRVLVHGVADLNRLKAIGITANVAIFPHGVLDVESVPRGTKKKGGPWIIGSYGFFLPHKGLIELIEAVAMLREKGIDAKLRMVNAEYPVADSASLIGEARDRIKELSLQQHVTLITEFLPDEASLAALADADLLVFPYQESGESASGAVRFGIASGRPVAVTPLPIFNDVRQAVRRLPGMDSADIAQGIAELLELLASQSEESAQWQRAADLWRESHRYSQLGWRLENMLFALRQARVSRNQS